MNHRFAGVVVAVMATWVSAWPVASAEPDATTSDLRCLVSAAVMSSSSDDPKVKSAGQLAAIYFLGRLDGRTPDLDLEARFAEQAHAMTDADVKSQLQSCGATLSARGAALQTIGKDLDQKQK